MPKKTRNNSRSTKLRRQAKALAVRQEGRVKTDWVNTVHAFVLSLAEGYFRMVCPDGETRDVSLERMRTHMEAAIIPDGMEPFGDWETFAHFAHIDLEYGALWLRPDGLWESKEDYFTDRQAAA